MVLPTMPPVWQAQEMSKRERKIRAKKSKQAIDAFTKDHIDIPNPLFTEVWVPFAKQVRYTDDRDIVAFTSSGNPMWKRQQAVQKFAWAVPSFGAILKILEFGRYIVEIGSGSGYWASLLAAAGASVTAVDIQQPPSEWFPDTICCDGLQYLRDHNGMPGSTLFLCWPALSIDAALDAFRGDTVIWIGEIDGCTDEVDSEEWKEIEQFRIPTWPLINDLMIIYGRCT